MRRAVERRFHEDHARRFTLGDDGVIQGAGAFTVPASHRHAVLLVHGFNDTAQSVASFAALLAGWGWTVRTPLLPGHGRSLDAIPEGSADRWFSHLRNEYLALRARYEHVVLCGQSMGGALCVRLAAEFEDVPALVLLAPFLTVPLSLELKILGAGLTAPVHPYRVSRGGERSIHDPEARARTLGAGIVTPRALRELRTMAVAAWDALPNVQAPTLYVQSREDNRISPRDAERSFKRVKARERRQVWLSGCGHIITADYCKEQVAGLAAEWFGQYAESPVREPTHRSSG